MQKFSWHTCKIPFESQVFTATFERKLSSVITLTSPRQPEIDKEVVLGSYGHSRALALSLMSCSPTVALYPPILTLCSVSENREVSCQKSRMFPISCVFSTSFWVIPLDFHQGLWHQSHRLTKKVVFSFYSNCLYLVPFPICSMIMQHWYLQLFWDGAWTDGQPDWRMNQHRAISYTALYICTAYASCGKI